MFLFNNLHADVPKNVALGSDEPAAAAAARHRWEVVELELGHGLRDSEHLLSPPSSLLSKC